MSDIITIFTPVGLTTLRTAATTIDMDPKTLSGLAKRAKKLSSVMRRGRGIGLASTQIGVLERMAVINRSADSSLKNDLVLINPEVVTASRTVVDLEEGCLSIPGVFGIVTRPEAVTVTTKTLSGETITVQAHDMLARVIQHEIDHLNGILFIDRTDRFTKGRELIP